MDLDWQPLKFAHKVVKTLLEKWINPSKHHSLDKKQIVNKDLK